MKSAVDDFVHMYVIDIYHFVVNFMKVNLADFIDDFLAFIRNKSKSYKWTDSNDNSNNNDKYNYCPR